MRVVVAGAHGKVARRLGRLLSARGDTVVGIVRNPDHERDLREDGIAPVVVDLEKTTPHDLSHAVSGADAVVFAAGAGPGSGPERKRTVDRGAAVLLADAAELAHVRPYVLVSSMGVEAVAHGGTPKGMDPVFAVYLQCKLAAEKIVLARERLATTVVRPGGLTDEPGSGRVALVRHAERGTVPRDDVAAVLLAFLDSPRDGAVVELVSGTTPIREAVASIP